MNARAVRYPSGPASPVATLDTAEGVRLGEILSALSYALDLTDGQPSGHTLRACLVGMRLGREVGLDEEALSALYFALLLKDAGCSSNAARMAALFGTADQQAKHLMRRADWQRTIPLALATLRAAGAGGSLIGHVRRFLRIARTSDVTRSLIEIRCERGAEIVRALGFPEATAVAVRCLDEHWNGGGYPEGAAGGAIPLLSRIANLAQSVEIFHTASGTRAALNMVRRRRGTWFDPALVDQLLTWRADDAWWASLHSDGAADLVLRAEPGGHARTAGAADIDAICRSFARIIDAKSPFTFQHSTNVAEYAVRIAAAMGFDDAEQQRLRRAGLLHDIGKLGVSTQILDKNGSLTPEERAEIERHAAFSWQILARVDAFRDFAWTAVLHHERLDGVGYPWGFGADQLDVPARILAVADVYEALTADRPYRAGMTRAAAMQLIRRDCPTRLCTDVVAGLEAALDVQP